MQIHVELTTHTVIHLHTHIFTCNFCDMPIQNAYYKFICVLAFTVSVCYSHSYTMKFLRVFYHEHTFDAIKKNILFWLLVYTSRRSLVLGFAAFNYDLISGYMLNCLISACVLLSLISIVSFNASVN